MGLLDDGDILQVNSGGFVGTSGSASLPAGTTAGSTVLIVQVVGTGGATPGLPSGFVQDVSAGVGLVDLDAYVWRKSNVGIGESSWTLGAGTGVSVAWVAMEIQGLDLTAPTIFPDEADSNAATNTTSVAAGPTPQASSAYDSLVFNVHCSRLATGTTPATWSGHTDSFVEVVEQGQAGSTDAVSVSVSRRFVTTIGTWSSTATASATQTELCGLQVIYRAAGARVADVPVMLTGFEHGSQTFDMTNAIGPWESQTGSPAVVTTTPRTGTYCLELSSAAAVENILLRADGTRTVLVGRFSMRFPTSLPGANVDLFSTVGDGTVHAVLRFKSATSKLAVQFGTGTERESTATVAIDDWIDVDLRITATGATWTLDWQVDGVAQTQATVAAGVDGFYSFRLGWTAASTATVRFDDVYFTATSGAYPLGDHQMRIVGVDTAGTITLTGTAANFNTFTNNGTMTAWNATTARDAIDELPPTIGATADGFAQVTAASGDYIDIPMATYAASPTHVVRAVRMLACGWAATSASSTLGIFATSTGVGEITLRSGGSVSSFTASTTSPAWACVMVRPVGGWTQARLDGLTFRVGKSSDATPDVGIHAVYAEVALQPVQVETVITMEAGAFTVDKRIDPVSSAVIAYDITTPPGRQADFHYTKLGTPLTVIVDPGTTVTEVVDAATFEDVSAIDLALDT